MQEKKAFEMLTFQFNTTALLNPQYKAIIQWQ